MRIKKGTLPIAIFVFVFILLSLVQLIPEHPFLLLERLFKNAGWIEVFLISLYGAVAGYKMQDTQQSRKWRIITWNIFTVFFFVQLLIGLTGFDKFLLTGKLHLPVPMMIIAGPVYRSELSVMTLLFISTIFLSGPAWCSHLCYFGALDNFFSARSSPENSKIRNRTTLKFTILFAVILFALIFRWFNLNLLISTILAGLFGVIGLVISVLFSRRKGKMMHCLSWCPIGTVVNYSKLINPFRMSIDMNTCTLCNKCSGYCRYDALNPEQIKTGRPDITCTYCGDCISACHSSSIQYKLFNLLPGRSRNIYLFITISLHAIFLAMGRI